VGDFYSLEVARMPRLFRRGVEISRGQERGGKCVHPLLQVKKLFRPTRVPALQDDNPKTDITRGAKKSLTVSGGIPLGFSQGLDRRK